jgi:predicted nucleic acid-binding protein
MISMSASPRLTFDSNVLIYAADRQAGPRHDVARRLVARASRANCILTLQALAEFFAVATRKKAVSAASAIAFVNGWQALFASAGATPASMQAAMHAVRDHRIGFWDAMLWAVAREAGCRYLLSEDFQGGQTLGGVTFVNPFGPAGLPSEVERLLGVGPG